MSTFFKNKWDESLFIGVMLLAFVAFYVETDIYTPSFPEMVNYFRTSEDKIQLLLSMNFLGLFLATLFFGPASDAYGRKAPLCSGLGLFMLGSVGCMWADSLNGMIVCRFFQGIGCGAIVGAGLTSFFDIYSPDKSSRLVALCNGTIGGMMALAPILGNWITLHLGWRANFYLIGILAVLSFFCVFLFTRETLPKEKRNEMNVIGILKSYAAILTNFPFIAHTLIWCLMFSLVIVFVANLALIFIDHLHVSKESFGYFQAAIMTAFFVGSVGGSYLIKKAGTLFTKVMGSSAYLSGIITLAIVTFLDSRSAIGLICCMSVISFGSALAMTIYFSYSMSYIDKKYQGAAMSLVQSIRLILTAGLVWLAAHWFDGSTKPATWLALVCSLICLVLYGLLFRKKMHLENPALT